MRKRQTDSLLSDWCKNQPGTHESLAFILDEKLGTLTAWLFKGYVPKAKIQKVSNITGIPVFDLIAECNRKRGL